jgi:serine/threonine protein phosphatase PrpC
VWRHIAQSVVGRNHSGDDASCQDTCVVRVVGEGDASVLVACVADGAGSSPHSAVGAQLACDSIMQAVVAHFDKHGRLDNLDAAEFVPWLDAARDVLSQQATSRDHALRDYATTLCVAITSVKRSLFVQIGDGVIVARRHGPLGVVFWPQSGEYANTTTFLTSAEFRDVVQIAVFDHGFTDVAILTDGLSRLALRFDSFTAHPPFFQPLFHALRAAADVDVLSEELRQFLSSDQVQSKTDDDKTLVLASQVADDDGHAH